MKDREVVEVIHEALIMYIDDISVIDDVKMISADTDGPSPERLLVTLKDGDKYKLILRKCAS